MLPTKPRSSPLSDPTVCWCEDCPVGLLNEDKARAHATRQGHTVLVQHQQTTIYETRKPR